FQVGHYGFQHATFGFKADRINDGIDSTITRGILNDKFSGIDFIKIDRNYSIGLMCETQTVRMVINHKNLLSTEHPRAGSSQQTDRASTINRHTGTSTNLGIVHCLPGGWQNIGQE